LQIVTSWHEDYRALAIGALIERLLPPLGHVPLSA